MATAQKTRSTSKKNKSKRSDAKTIASVSTADLSDVRRSEFLEFYSDFERRLDDLKDALSNTKRTKELAAALKEKGAFKNFIGSFSGRNDKELAQMIENLGASMETTQIILQLVMKVQNAKNHFLKEFHKALVDKVVLLEKDKKTLDSNQRAAAIAIVSKLRDQVESQLANQALVEEHQKKLREIDGFVTRKDHLDQEQSEKISDLESRALEIIRTDEEQQRLIGALKDAHAEKDDLDRIQTQRIDTLMTAVSQLELDNEKHGRAISLVEHQHELLFEQLRLLEASIRDRDSLGVLLRRNLVPGIALLVGAAALVLHFTS